MSIQFTSSTHYSELAQTPQSRDSVTQDCSHFSNKLKVLSLSKPAAPLTHPATNLEFPTIPWISIILQKAHRTHKSVRFKDYHLNIKNANEQQMKKYTGQIWKCPKHRSFWLHVVWRYHPPGTYVHQSEGSLNLFLQHFYESFIIYAWLIKLLRWNSIFSLSSFPAGREVSRHWKFQFLNHIFAVSGN